MTLKDGFVRLN